MVVHRLCQIPVAFLYFPTVGLHPGLTAFHSSAWCRERLYMQKNVTFAFFSSFHILWSWWYDSSEPVPSTSSEPVDVRSPTQEGKQTSQESASTSERLRSNQALVKNLILSLDAHNHVDDYSGTLGDVRKTKQTNKNVDDDGGSQLELEETKSNAVIRQACTEFCSRCKRQSQLGKCGIVLKNRCQCV